MSYKSNLQANNIRLNTLKTEINNLPTFVDTTDANATANDIMQGKTAYVNGEKITGIASNVFVVPKGMKFNTSNVTNFPQMDFSQVIDMSSMFSSTTGNLPNNYYINCPNATNFSKAFHSSQIFTAPTIDMSNATSLQTMFTLSYVQNVPFYNIPKVTNMSNMFLNHVYRLTDDSLNNILAMCISAVSYTGTKTLRQLSLSSDDAARCPTLSNWNEFVEAGWSTGY